MMIEFKDGIVKDYTLVLSKRNWEHLGQIVNVSGVTYKRNMNAANELSFTINKEVEGIVERLWDEIYDLRLVWVKELNEYFEIKVSQDEQIDSTKSITGTSLCEAELSQTMLYGIEINTDEDVLIPYGTDDQGKDLTKASIFYDPNILKKSILHRVLDKVPQYTILEPDLGLKESTKVPEFTFDGTSVLDALNQIAEEYDCMFKFDSAKRTIKAIDLETVCLNDNCDYYIETEKKRHYRGVFNDYCPKCGSTNLLYHGKDTTICVGVDNLTDSISYEVDADSIKNTFRLECGDEISTAYAIEANNGSQYIYNFPEETLRDMSEGLVARFNAQQKIIDNFNDHSKYKLTYQEATVKYFEILEKYAKYYYAMIPVETAVPGPKISDDAEERTKYFAGLVKKGFDNNGINLAKATTAENEIYTYVKSMAKVYANTFYVDISKIELKDSVKDSSGNYTKVKYAITLTDWESEESSTPITSTIETNLLTIKILGLNQYASKIESYISSANNLKKYDMLNWLSYSSYKNTGKNNYTEIFESSYVQKLCQDMKATLLADHYKNTKWDDNGHFVSGTWTDGDSGATGYNWKEIYNIKESFGVCAKQLDNIANDIGNTLVKADDWKNFRNAYARLEAQAADCLRLREIDVAKYRYPGGFGVADNYADSDTYKKSEVKKIIDTKDMMQRAANFDNIVRVKDNDLTKYINNPADCYEAGKLKDPTEEYYNEFCSFRREDTYKNDNFISDNIKDNDEDMFTRMNEFLHTAKQELIKASTYQYSISSNLKNLLLIPEFKPLTEYFEVGNWIRFKIDGSTTSNLTDRYYRLRLTSFEINFDSIQDINCEFSNLTETADGCNDIASVLSQASSMASSYSAITRQTEASKEATAYVESALSQGLTTALEGIKSANHQEVLINDAGYLGRRYDPFEEKYDDEQVRISNNLIVFTDNNWETASAALGKHNTIIYDYDSAQEKVIPKEISQYGLSAKFVNAGYITGETSIYGAKFIGGHIYSDNYEGTNAVPTIGTHIDLENGAIYSPHFNIDSTGNAKYSGTIESKYFNADSNGVRLGTTDNPYATINSSSATFSNLKIIGSSFESSTKDSQGNPLFKVDKDGNITGATITGSSGIFTQGFEVNVTNENKSLFFENISNNGANIGMHNVEGEGGMGYLAFDTGDGRGNVTSILTGDYVSIGSSGGFHGDSSILLGKGDIHIMVSEAISVNTDDWVMLHSYMSIYALLEGSSNITVSQPNSTTSKIQVKNNNNTADIRVTENAGLYHNTDKGFSTGKWLIYIDKDGTVHCNGTSDRRLKYEIEDMTDREAQLLLSVKPKTFKFKASTDGTTHQGFIAQDFRDVLTDNDIGYRSLLQISDINDGETMYKDLEHSEEDVMYGIDYAMLVPVLWKGYQMQQEQIESLKSEIQQLKEKKENE